MHLYIMKKKGEGDMKWGMSKLNNNRTWPQGDKLKVQQSNRNWRK